MHNFILHFLHRFHDVVAFHLNVLFYYLAEKEKNYCALFLKYFKENKSLGVKYTTVTEKEKANIVKAIGLSQGHWFKCPKGKNKCTFLS